MKIAVGLTKYIFDFYIDILDKVYQEIIKFQKKLNKDLGEEYEKSWEFTKRQYNTYIIEAMKNFFGEYENNKLIGSNDNRGRCRLIYMQEHLAVE